MRPASLCVLFVSLLGACGSGVDDDPALYEPLQVVDGTFRPGRLPGVEVADPESAEGPRITACVCDVCGAPWEERTRMPRLGRSFR